MLARGGVGCGGMLVVHGGAIRPLVPRPVTCRARTHDFAVVGEDFKKVCGTRPLCTNTTSTFHEHMPMSSKCSCAKLSSQCLAMNFAWRSCVDWSIKCACSPAPYPWLRAESHAGQRRCTGDVNAHQVVGMVAIRDETTEMPRRGGGMHGGLAT